jgi:hypothetical protein
MGDMPDQRGIVRGASSVVTGRRTACRRRVQEEEDDGCLRRAWACGHRARGKVSRATGACAFVHARLIILQCLMLRACSRIALFFAAASATVQRRRGDDAPQLRPGLRHAPSKLKGH